MNERVISMGMPLVETTYQINKVLNKESIIVLRTIHISQPRRNTPIGFELRSTPDSQNAIETLIFYLRKQSKVALAGVHLNEITIDCRKVKLELVVKPSKNLPRGTGNWIELTYSSFDGDDNSYGVDFPNFGSGELMNSKHSSRNWLSCVKE
ncbi:MAG: hypothetical protein MUF75_01885 [Bacteroidia bacterium]|jgi:hypothetical protein|nr:hypothetical protein [Bacteroidia bacterium]